jgi:DtxR family Mn-dependent transcriptional regulator
MKLSESEENYIKSIYTLQEKTGKVNTNSLAKFLNTSAASITDMLKKLNLNEAGKKEALKIIRRHRLWEFFLVSKLGMEWEKVHDIAEELEHVSSLELINRLDSYLGNPKIDPHGDPIPDESGNIQVLKQIVLREFPVNKSAVVSSVSNQTPEMMEMLNHYSIGIGSHIKILKSFGFDGSLEIKIARKPECIISGIVAQNIFVYDN